ncbi:MAG: hypothetical protein WCX71_04585 [Candidatus Buchananbacteria bacterium]
MAYPTPIRPQSTNPSAPGTFDGAKKKPAQAPWLKGLVTLIIVLAIIGGGIYLLVGYTGLGNGLFSSISPKATWQAVFLSNGQVYFGKISGMNKNFMDLKNIYYLQVTTKQDTIGQPSDVQTQSEQQLTLIKLGNEIHGPKDDMMINRDQVLMVEDLKDDSRVVQAINDYLNSQKKK